MGVAKEARRFGVGEVEAEEEPKNLIFLISCSIYQICPKFVSSTSIDLYTFRDSANRI
jgi:hypothetical protein